VERASDRGSYPGQPRPRRVNLHANTQRTVDFHSNLMEFDIPDTANWHTISMTTRDFDARPGHRQRQMALMDWESGSTGGRGLLQVDVVNAAEIDRRGGGDRLSSADSPPTVSARPAGEPGFDDRSPAPGCELQQLALDERGKEIGCSRRREPDPNSPVDLSAYRAACDGQGILEVTTASVRGLLPICRNSERSG